MIAVPESPFRILVVDGSEDVRQFLCRLLLDCGYETATAGTGAEACSRMDQARFELVILDTVLPDVRGSELIGRIRRDHPRAAMVVVSGCAGCLERPRLAEMGVSRVLSKPFKPAALLDAVEALSGRTGQAPRPRA